MIEILDYDDMVKVGSAPPNTSNLKDGQRKYAVIIKNAYASIGKFDITDSASTEESIFALQNNAGIPDVIRKSAEYYVKNAADYFGISYDISPQPTAHEIIVSDIIAKTAEYDDVPMLTFGEKKFILSDEEHVKQAEEYFMLKKHLYPPSQRINVSRIIVKAAATMKYIPGDVVKAYSRAEYGNQVEEVLTKKASLTNNDKYASVMATLSKCYSSIPVPEFLDMVETCDKAAEVRHNRYGIESHDLLTSISKTALDKLEAAVEKPATLQDLTEDD